MINSLIIDVKDNVAVVIKEIAKGEEINYKFDNEEKTLIAKDNIKIYHKFATKDIKKGDPIIKYGQHIGLAGTDIESGEHVHVHNVENHREEL